MTTPRWYIDWARDHCIAFGFGDTQAETVLAWGPIFASLFRADELKAATGFLLASADAPKFASDHRGAIIRAVSAVRQRGTAKAVESSLATGCIECGGCGIVVVPHPGTADSGHAMRRILMMPNADPTGLTRTMGVCCVLCPAGVKTREVTEANDRPLMTISQYEHLFPNWRAVRDKRVEVLTAGRSTPTPADVAELNRTLRDAREVAARRASGHAHREAG